LNLVAIIALLITLITFDQVLTRHPITATSDAAVVKACIVMVAVAVIASFAGADNSIAAASAQATVGAGVGVDLITVVASFARP
jgi:hypothetical protein